jgi:hypothetical protein
VRQIILSNAKQNIAVNIAGNQNQCQQAMLEASETMHVRA